MYGNNFSIKFFRLKPPMNLQLMYTKVVELEQLYLVNKEFLNPLSGF